MKSHIVYGLVLTAGGVVALVPMPYKLFGLAMLIVAFGWPIYSVFIAKASDHFMVFRRPEDLLMPAMASSAHIMTGGRYWAFRCLNSAVRT